MSDFSLIPFFVAYCYIYVDCQWLYALSVYIFIDEYVLTILNTAKLNFFVNLSVFVTSCFLLQVHSKQTQFSILNSSLIIVFYGTN